MDLKKFCALADDRPELAIPFSKGEWTFATDGRVLIRLPRQPDVPEVEKAPDAAALFKDRDPASCTKRIAIELPAADDEPDECGSCDGRGTEHDCPSCGCKCHVCDGSGFEPPWHGMSLGIGSSVFNAKYVARIKDLPGLKFAEPKGFEPLMFAFEGGDGLIMPMVSKSANHIDLKEAA